MGRICLLLCLFATETTFAAPVTRSVSQRLAQALASKGAAYLKMSAEQAAEATAAVVQLMPEEWRGNPGIPALAELPARPDCAAVLKELTRGIPLHMLLERGKDSLHLKNDRSLLFAPDFFAIRTFPDRFQLHSEYAK